MERRHTPGPWRWTDDGNGNKYGRNRLEPCVVSGTVEGMIDVDDDDAALIAASPELLEALKLLYAHLFGPKPSQSLSEIDDLCRAAIAKAEGRA